MRLDIQAPIKCTGDLCVLPNQSLTALQTWATLPLPAFQHPISLSSLKESLSLSSPSPSVVTSEQLQSRSLIISIQSNLWCYGEIVRKSRCTVTT